MRKDLAPYIVKPEKARAVDMWNDFIDRLDDRIPRFPIWTDVFLGRLAVSPEHDGWKNALIAKSALLYEEHRDWIEAWAAKWDLPNVIPSYRRARVAGTGWRARHLGPCNSVPAKRRPREALTYLPALVAINQTSIIGPQRRSITPHEAGLLQGFRHDAFGEHVFVQHSDPGVAFRQFGNAVHVGTMRLVAESLVDGTRGLGPVPVPLEWHAVAAHMRDAPSSPEQIVKDDGLDLVE